MKVFHRETPRRPLREETRGARVGGGLPESKRCGVTEHRSSERRVQSTGGAVLCPATCLSGSAGRHKPPPLC